MRINTAVEKFPGLGNRLSCRAESFSATIAHKTDIGGVKLNLQHEAALRVAYRAIKSGADVTLEQLPKLALHPYP